MSNKKQLLVRYDLDYALNDKRIIIKKGEKLNLIAKNNDEWCLVSRSASTNERSKEGSFHSKARAASNHPFFVHASFLRPSSYSSVPDLTDTPDEIVPPLRYVTNHDKALNKFIGSSRESLDGLTNERTSSLNSSRYDTQSNSSFCDRSPNGNPSDLTSERLEGIYVDPIELKAKPRKSRADPPEYANLSPLNARKELWHQYYRAKAKQSPPSPTDSIEDVKRVLFDHWTEHEDQHGRKFYYNSTTRTSSWKPPRRLTTKVEHVMTDGHRGAHCERKHSLDSQTVLQSCERDCHSSCECDREPLRGQRQRHPMITRPDVNDSSVGEGASTREQSTQTDSVLEEGVTHVAIPMVPAGWRGFMDPLTREVYFVSPYHDHKWFCKRDENGRIYYYEENGQGILAELPTFDDARHYLTHDTVGQDNKSPKSPKSGLKLANKSGEGLHASMDRSIKAHSVAMMPSRNAKPDMIIFKEKFKHSSPFQNVSVIFPAPPTSLNMKEIINSGTLNRTRTAISGKMSKRKNWGTSYLVLTKYYLLFFKDQKAAFVTSDLKPEFVLGLLNATIDWCPNKSSRKNCFQVSTFQDQVLLQDDNNDHSAKWFSAIRDCIAKLPTPLSLASSASIVENIEKPGSFKLKRSRSTKHSRPVEEFPIQSGRATLSGYATIANTPMTDKKVKIRERLRQFLRKRPTMESLREKGIIKDENVFGCNLDLLCQRDKSSIPNFVKQCVEAIEFKDLKADGIYRACGNLSTVQKLRFEINQDNYQGLWKEEDVHVLTGLLKMFFRNMPEPLFPCDRFKTLMECICIKNKDAKVEAFRKVIRELPDCNHQTLKYIIKHLLRITEYQHENRMSVQNLAIVFGPTLIRPMNDLNNLVLDMMLQMQQSQVIEFLLLEYDAVFN